MRLGYSLEGFCLSMIDDDPASLPQRRRREGTAGSIRGTVEDDRAPWDLCWLKDLKIENIDLNRKQLTIEAAYSKNRETQTIPLHSKLVAALQKGFSRVEAGWYLKPGKGSLCGQSELRLQTLVSVLICPPLCHTPCGIPLLQGWGWQG